MSEEEEVHLCAYLFGTMSNEEVDIQQSDIDCPLRDEQGKKLLTIIHESRFFDAFETSEMVGGPSTAKARVLAKALLVCLEMEKLPLPTVELNLIGGFCFFWDYTHYCIIRSHGNVDSRFGEETLFAVPFHQFMAVWIPKIVGVKVYHFQPDFVDSQVGLLKNQ